MHSALIGQGLDMSSSNDLERKVLALDSIVLGVPITSIELVQSRWKSSSIEFGDGVLFLQMGRR